MASLRPACALSGSLALALLRPCPALPSLSLSLFRSFFPPRGSRVPKGFHSPNVGTFRPHVHAHSVREGKRRE